MQRRSRATGFRLRGNDGPASSNLNGRCVYPRPAAQGTEHAFAEVCSLDANSGISRAESTSKGPRLLHRKLNQEDL